MNDLLLSFKRDGFIHLPGIIPESDVTIARQISLYLKEKIVNDNLLNQEKNYGAPVYSRSLDMSAKLDNRLYELSKSEWLIKLVKILLEQEYVYLFNEQVVVKLPNEDFLFPAHTDNFFGPDPDAAVRGDFKTVTCCWVLDNFSEDNGPIRIKNKSTDEWCTPMPKLGDFMAWDGNTVHESGINITGDPRCVWLQIYSTHDISNMKNVNEADYVKSVDFTRFHSYKF